MEHHWRRAILEGIAIVYLLKLNMLILRARPKAESRRHAVGSRLATVVIPRLARTIIYSGVAAFCQKRYGVTQ